MSASQTTNLPASSKSLGNSALALLGGLVSALAMLGATTFHPAPPREIEKKLGIEANGQGVTLSPGAPQWESIRVGSALSASAGWTDAYPARFKVDEARAARVGTPLAGRVTRVLVELGDPVKAGAPLFSVASGDVAALRSEQQRAQVELAAAKEKHERIQSMVTAHALPGKDELEAAAQLHESELGLKLANAKLASLRVATGADNELTVVAPRDGVVVKKNVLPAQQVTSDDSLLEVADLSDVWAVAELFEADAQGIGTNTLAHLTRAELPGFSWEGKVDAVSSVVDPDAHTVSVRVVVPNLDHRLRPNTFVEMRFQQHPAPGAVEIAASALVSDGAEKYVYVQQGAGHFVRRRVTAGSSNKNRVVVTSGLSVGDQVVEEGSALLDNEIILTH